MSDSPIFNQLVKEFATKGAAYDEFIKWAAPVFEWTPRPVVQLDKQRQGVRLDKAPEVPRVIGINKRPELLGEYKKMQALIGDTGLLVQEYIARVGEEFAENHPLAIITDVKFEPNNDGSSTVVIEAVQPITSVMPLSERNTAQPME